LFRFPEKVATLIMMQQKTAREDKIAADSQNLRLVKTIVLVWKLNNMPIKYPQNSKIYTAWLHIICCTVISI